MEYKRVRKGKKSENFAFLDGRRKIKTPLNRGLIERFVTISSI
jgi:hypothetical protein